MHETVIRGGLTKTPTTAELIYVIHHMPPTPGETSGSQLSQPVRPTGEALSFDKMTVVYQIVPQDNLQTMMTKELDDEAFPSPKK